MSRGRPRKFDPTIPAHVDQRKLPKGAYWDARAHVWYTLLPKWQRLAGPAATVADLHVVLADLRAGSAQRGTFAWLHEQFSDPKNKTWQQLSAATQKDYHACQRVLARTKTSTGVSYATLQVDRITKVHLQLLVDAIGATRPAMANHVKRYLGRLIAWGMTRGKCHDRPNPAHGLDAAVERRQFKMPTREVMWVTISFARDRGTRTPHTAGSCPPYLWILMVLAYRMRLRTIEVITLTDAHEHAAGVRTNRRKGSRDNITRWAGSGSAGAYTIEDAWLTAWEYREQVWKRMGLAVPLKAEDRPLLVNEEGRVLDSEAVSSALDRFMKLAIREHIITAEQRYTLHGLKHRGITDSKNKKDGGHATDTMVNRYDHDLPLVDQAGSTIE